MSKKNTRRKDRRKRERQTMPEAMALEERLQYERFKEHMGQSVGIRTVVRGLSLLLEGEE